MIKEVNDGTLNLLYNSMISFSPEKESIDQSLQTVRLSTPLAPIVLQTRSF